MDIVKRCLDLIDDVEGTRAGEEHGEQEGQRRHRLLSAGEQRQALGRLARGRDLDLDARQLLLLAPGLGFALRLGGGLDRPRRDPRSRFWQRLSAQHRARRLLVARPAAGGHARRGRRRRSAPRSCARRPWKVSSKVRWISRSVSRITVRSSRQGGLEVDCRRRSSSSCTWASASLVLVLGKGVDGSDLLAAARQSLPGGRRSACASLSSQRLLAFRRGLKLSADRASTLAARARPPRPGQALRGDLGGVTASPQLRRVRLDLGLLAAHARSAGGDLFTRRGSAASACLEPREARAGGGRGRLRASRQALGARRQRGVRTCWSRSRSRRACRSARSRCESLSLAALGRELALELRLADRQRTLRGRRAALLDQPLASAPRLARLGAAPLGVAQRAVGADARRVGRRSLRAPLAGAARGVLACAARSAASSSRSRSLRRASTRSLPPRSADAPPPRRRTTRGPGGWRRCP